MSLKQDKLFTLVFYAGFCVYSVIGQTGSHLSPYFPYKLHELMLLTYNKAA